MTDIEDQPPPADPADHPADPADPAGATAEPQALSDELEQWLGGEGDKTLGSLVTTFGEKSFAVLFVLLLGVPALPLPTGGATHVFEIIAVLLALELIVGRRQVWLPQRWQRLELAGARQQRFIASLTKLIRRLERLSRPRLAFVFEHRLSNAVFGVLVIAGAVGAFFAPPFTGLDTLPSLGVVILSLGVLLEDALVVIAGIAVGRRRRRAGDRARRGGAARGELDLLGTGPIVRSRAAAAAAADSRTSARRGSCGSPARLSSTSGTPPRATLAASTSAVIASPRMPPRASATAAVASSLTSRAVCTIPTSGSAASASA